jgi:serine/threonine protein kinase
MTNLLKVGQIFDDRYEITGVLGSGGLGTVYTARQEQANRTIALKIGNFSYIEDADSEARFLREGKVLGGLSHPNIVQIYHLGISRDGFPYIAMELVDGISIRRAMSERGIFPLTESLRIIRDAALALSYVHLQGIIHRDLKLDNILLSELPAHNTVKIIDFGLARLEKSTDERLTQAGDLLGTADYMSPEQCAGKTADARSDVYSLTVCLYEMLTGKPPFESDSAVGVMYKHMSEQVPLVKGGKLEQCRSVLNEIIKTGMAKSPEQRFQTMAEFGAKLSEVLETMESGSGGAALPGSKILLPVCLLVVISGAVVAVGSHLNWLAPGSSVRRSTATPVTRTTLPSLVAKAQKTDDTWDRALLLHDAYGICCDRANKSILGALRLNITKWYARQLQELGLSREAYSAAMHAAADVEKNGMPEEYGMGHGLGKTGFPWRDYLDNGHTITRILIDWGRPQEAGKTLKGFLARVQPKTEDSWIETSEDLLELQLNEDFSKLVDACFKPDCLIMISRSARQHGKPVLAAACLKKADSIAAHVELNKEDEQLLELEHASVDLVSGKKTSALDRVNRLAKTCSDEELVEHKSLAPGLSIAYALLDEPEKSRKYFSGYKNNAMASLAKLPPLERCLAFCRQAEDHDAAAYRLCYSSYALELCRQPEGRAIPEGLRLRALFNYAGTLKRLALPSLAVPCYERLLEDCSKLASEIGGGGQVSISPGQILHAQLDLAQTWIDLGETQKAEKVMDQLWKQFGPGAANRNVVDTELSLCRTARVKELIAQIGDVYNVIAIFTSCLRHRQWDLAASALARADLLLKERLRAERAGRSGPGNPASRKAAGDYDRLAAGLAIRAALLKLEQDDRTAAGQILKQCLQDFPPASTVWAQVDLRREMLLALALAGMRPELQEIQSLY